MDYTSHPSNNVFLIGNGLHIDDMPATYTRYEDGSVALVSFWRPTPQELEALNANGLVKLHVLGGTAPPVAVCVEGVS